MPDVDRSRWMMFIAVAVLTGLGRIGFIGFAGFADSAGFDCPKASRSFSSASTLAFASCTKRRLAPGRMRVEPAVSIDKQL